MSEEEHLIGGRTAGAVRVGDTVIRRGGSWTPTVHSLLRHLESVGFGGAPTVVGFNDNGDEVLSYLSGSTVGGTVPWPPYVISEDALVQVGGWMRRLHDCTRSFTPPANATWFSGRTWQPGLIIGHHDAAPYNAVWDGGGLVGFVDWDTAGPSTPELDLAYTALSWVPLLLPQVAMERGFPASADLSRRLHLLLDAYGYRGDRSAFGVTVVRRARLSAEMIRRLAAEGNPTYQAMLPGAQEMDLTADHIEHLPAHFWSTEPVQH